MILLQKNNFCTALTEHFEKVKGKIQEMSHHLHKLIYLLELYSLRRDFGKQGVLSSLSVKWHLLSATTVIWKIKNCISD